ncbi:baseplate J/gp47 family protein [Oceanicella sp. SM1341]|uniref:baseplate J/gp47 family protein n=1 Tax=Oceanicella sp. SM1341 TaxID=1548889 RepID=UPI000E520CB7|nr:baseplate J/gp47 family protein [Oceanicella sp. SM1341]
MPTCPCDAHPPDTCPEIPAGLTDLPLPATGFPEFRRAMLEDIAGRPALSGWSAEAEQDLGVMLLEMWAYVLDITRFYDARITGEFYLPTAQRRLSAERLVRLLGYQPRPALSARVWLAAEAGGTGALPLPVGTAFRSEAFGDEPPQVFSLTEAQEIRPERNGWALRPVPGSSFPGRLLAGAGDAGLPKSGVVAFRVGSEAVHAGRIVGTRTLTGPDGARYRETELEEGTGPLAGRAVADIRQRLMGLEAGPTAFGDGVSGGALVLDGLYPQLRPGQIAVLETGGTLYPFIIPDAGVSTKAVVVGRTPALSEPEVPAQDITAPASTVALPSGFAPVPGATARWRLHFNPLRAGRPAAPARTQLSQPDLGAGMALEMPARPGGQALSGPFVLQGEAPRGVLVSGQVTTDPVTGEARFSPGTGIAAFPDALRAPFRLRGNLVRAVRGERVAGEVIGSADAGAALNRFRLKRKPLSWVEDGSAPGGIRPLLEVRVNGVLWARVPTLYAAGPADRVYMLETEEDGATHVRFGDGRRGAVPETGQGNVTATYQHGAGAAKPPPGSIRQIVKPPRGLERVVNPLPAEGGRDAETAEELKRNAPAAALTLGRAVSVQDFAALARSFAGVVNLSAGWAWDPRRQRALVSIRVIGDAEDGSGVDTVALERWLAGQAAPDTPVRVQPAVADAHALALSLAVRPDHEAATVRAAVRDALFDMLSPARVEVGGVLYRSRLIAAAQGVPGVEAVTALRLDGAELAWALRVQAGHYPRFHSVTVS